MVASLPVVRVCHDPVSGVYARMTGSLPFALRVVHWASVSVMVSAMAGENWAPSGPHMYTGPLKVSPELASVAGTRLLASGWMLTSDRICPAASVARRFWGRVRSAVLSSDWTPIAAVNHPDVSVVSLA